MSYISSMSKKKRVVLIISIILGILAIIAGVTCAVKFGGNNKCKFDREVVADEYLAAPATCEHGAIYYKSCEHGDKGEETFVYGEPLGHVYGEWIIGKSPTCTENGELAHFHCSRCEKNFDTDKKEISTVTIKATGHNFKNYVSNGDATCTENGTESAMCENGCGTIDTKEEKLSALWHDCVYTPNGNGTHTVTCKRDGCNYTETLNCSGGSATCEIEAECQYCLQKYGNLAGHSYERTAAKAATCSQAGNYEYYHCSVCNKYFDAEKTEKEYNDLTIPAKAHVYGDANYTWSSDNTTCTATRSCSVCKKGVQTETVTATPSTTEATCTTPSSTTYTPTFTVGWATNPPTKTVKGLKALGHNYGEWTEKAPTCTDDGILGHYYCDRCKNNFDKNSTQITKSLTITALGHEYNGADVSYVWKEDHTSCTASRICKNGCGSTQTATVTQADEKITNSEKKATCVDKQVITYKADFTACDWINKYVTEDVVGEVDTVNGHSFTKYISNNDATCTQGGTKKANCDHSGCTETDTIDDEDAPALGHDYNGADVSYVWNDEHTSCTASRLCTVCKKSTQTATVTQADEKITHSETEATCVAPKVTTYKADFTACDWINKYVTENVEGEVDTVNGHDYALSKIDYKWNDEHTSCTASCLCTVCKKSTQTATVTQADEKITNSETKATCVAPNVTTYKADFTDCDWINKYVTEDVVGEVDTVNGHSYGDWNKDEGTTTHSKTCSLCEEGVENHTVQEACADVNKNEEGYTDHYCDSCNRKLTEHTGGKATCTKQAQCTICGNPYGDIDAEAHDWGEWEGNAGTHVRTCKNSSSHSQSDSCTLDDTGICTVCGNSALSFTALDEEITSYAVGGIGAYSGSALTIPTTHNGKPVTAIANNAFKDNTSLTSVTIPNGITSIGELAFNGCLNLKEVTIENGITEIVKSTFAGCISLTSVTIPASVTTIGEHAFGSCKALESITLPTGLTYIGPQAFASCEKLKGITIPNGVQTLGAEAFRYCIALESIMIPNSVTSIGDGAFQNCTALTSITIPNSVTSIGAGSFMSCTALTSITMSSGVTSIGDRAIYNCTALNSIYIPDSVTNIGIYAFYGCSSLENINVDSNNKNYKSIDGSLYTKDGKTLIQCAQGKKQTSFVLPDGVTSIDSWAFNCCSTLISIYIPDSVVEIGGTAFGHCSALKTVYYKGTADDWGKISIKDNNEYLYNATKYYYSESYVSGCWHYVDGVPTLW